MTTSWYAGSMEPCRMATVMQKRHDAGAARRRLQGTAGHSRAQQDTAGFFAPLPGRSSASRVATSGRTTAAA